MTRGDVPGWFTLIVLAAVSGCSNPDAPKVTGSQEEATVTGIVRVRGKPVNNGSISFKTANINLPQVPMREVPIGTDGRYTVKTLIGDHIVSVTCKELNDPKNRRFLENGRRFRLAREKQRRYRYSSLVRNGPGITSRFLLMKLGAGLLTPPECLTEGLLISRRAPSAGSPGPHRTGRPPVGPTAGSGDPRRTHRPTIGRGGTRATMGRGRETRHPTISQSQIDGWPPRAHGNAAKSSLRAGS